MILSSYNYVYYMYISCKDYSIPGGSGTKFYIISLRSVIYVQYMHPKIALSNHMASCKDLYYSS